MLEHDTRERKRLRDLFVEVTGRTTVRERQQDCSRRGRSADWTGGTDERDLAADVAEYASEDGLDEAIDGPGGTAGASADQ